MPESSLSEKLPFAHLKVYEFGSNVAGPYVSWILAELGAEVIKVERPEGDDARDWGPPFWNGSSTVFQAINRGKKSITLDFNDAEAVARLKRRIISDADVVVQNLRAGVAEKFGLGAEDFRAENPRLIYCNLHAYGATGPMKDLPGYDALVQAFGGVMSVTGEDNGNPVRAGVSLIDMGTGMWTVIALLTALHRRAETGQGAVVDTSLFETALGWMIWHATGFQASGEVPVPRGSGVRGIAPYQAYDCSDGRLLVAGSNDRLFARLAKTLGHSEWARDERFSTNPVRVENRDALNALIEPILAAESRAHWQDRFNAAGVPCAPIQDIAEVLAHAQTAALGMAQSTHDPAMKLLGLPFSIDGWRPPLRDLAPELGAHNDEVFGEDRAGETRPATGDEG